jgi:hypothetical protein
MTNTKTYTGSKPKFDVKITKPNGEVVRRYSNYKLRTLSFSKANYSKGDRISLKVTYKEGFTNEGNYHDWPEFYRAWQAFTEKDLITDVIKHY